MINIIKIYANNKHWSYSVNVSLKVIYYAQRMNRTFVAITSL